MIREMHDDEFDTVFALMRESFPIDEYRPYEEQKALLCLPNFTVYVLSEEHCTRIQAFITVYRFEQFAFVEHFAVNPADRNHGIGAQVLAELRALLSCRICLEVELPETSLAERRLRFYERNGFFLCMHTYFQPPISQGKQAVPLRIMTNERAATDEEFQAIRAVLYREVYHVECSGEAEKSASRAVDGIR